MVDFLLMPLKPLPFVGSGLIAKNTSSHKKIVHLNGSAPNSFPSSFRLCFPPFPFYSFLHRRASFTLLLRCTAVVCF